MHSPAPTPDPLASPASLKPGAKPPAPKAAAQEALRAPRAAITPPELQRIEDLHALLIQDAAVFARRPRSGREPVSRIFETVATFGDFTLEGLVDLIEAGPPKPDLWRFYPPLLSKFGILPILQGGDAGKMCGDPRMPFDVGARQLLTDSTELRLFQGNSIIVLGILAQREGKNLDPELIRTRLEDCMRFAREYPMEYAGLKNAEHRFVWLLLTESEQSQLSGLVQDQAKRRQFLQQVDPERSTIEMGYALISNAILRRASDIHLEPLRAGDWRARLRIDGSLIDLELRSKDLDATFRRLIARYKSMANLRLDEHRRFQSGEISFKEEDISAEIRRGVIAKNSRILGHSLRVEVVPTKLGESLSMRLLSTSSEALSFQQLGLSGTTLERLRALFQEPDGLVIVTGPTGSGKSTTLYAGLSEVNRPDIKILSAEDPVERQIPGLVQVPIKRDIGLDFPTALRGFLRADPDVVLIGEIRDRETATIAVQAANTGHLVLSTLHTNDAVLALTRLKELGIDDFLLQDTLRAVVAQRLVRVLCPECRESYDASDELNRAFGEERFAPQQTSPAAAENPENKCAEPEPKGLPQITLFRPPQHRDQFNPCPCCKGAGYKGRTVVPEIWILGEEERELIRSGELSHRRLFDAALKGGMIPMFSAGMALAREGRTSFEEVRASVLRASNFSEHRELLLAGLRGETLAPRDSGTQ